MSDLTIRRKNYNSAKEIKASAHYSYIVNGITVDGSKFAKGAFVAEGTCLGKNADGKYEKWADDGNLTNPVILDESIQFKLDDQGNNPDVTAGQVLVHGAVYESMLVGVTAAFKTAVGAAIRFV